MIAKSTIPGWAFSWLRCERTLQLSKGALPARSVVMQRCAAHLCVLKIHLCACATPLEQHTHKRLDSRFTLPTPAKAELRLRLHICVNSTTGVLGAIRIHKAHLEVPSRSHIELDLQDLASRIQTQTTREPAQDQSSRAKPCRATRRSAARYGLKSALGLAPRLALLVATSTTTIAAAVASFASPKSGWSGASVWGASEVEKSEPVKIYSRGAKSNPICQKLTYFIRCLRRSKLL
jgi:hypothetical protein